MMITREFQMDIVNRIASARRARCGGDVWVQPPAGWAIIVRESWPLVWSQDPSRCPDGWCDMLMAFSEHAVELGGGGLMHDALENTLTGMLLIERFYDDDRSVRLLDAVQGYRQVSLSICRECGGPGAPHRVRQGLQQVLCLQHSEWRGQ